MAEKSRSFIRAANIVLFVLALVSLVNVVITLITNLPMVVVNIAAQGMPEWEIILIIYMFVFAWKHRKSKPIRPDL